MMEKLEPPTENLRSPHNPKRLNAEATSMSCLLDEGAKQKELDGTNGTKFFQVV